MQRPEDLENFAVHLRVFGKVQGVGFRAWAKQEADKRGLRGWVRNEADGSVTALIVGSDAVVSAMIKRLWQGPPGAVVSGVTSEEKTDPGDASEDFRMVRRDLRPEGR